MAGVSSDGSVYNNSCSCHCNKVVKQSTNNPKNGGLNPAIDTGREKMLTKNLNLKQEVVVQWQQ